MVRDAEDKLAHMCNLLANAQMRLMLTSPQFDPRLGCCRCGEPYPYPIELKDDPATPTTKVSHLVITTCYPVALNPKI